MSKLMWIVGILMAAAGLALALMIVAATSSVVAWGLTPQLAATLFAGGVLSIGVGGIISAIEHLHLQRVDMSASLVAAAPVAPIPEFGRRAAEPAAPAVAAVVAAEEEVSEPVKETIAALEQARQKIEQAFEPKPEPPAAPETPAIAFPPTTAEEPAPEPVAEAAPAPEPEEPADEEGEAEEALEEGQLYVVEERFIRQRPARILSDGTVEAETDEGWMRFENLEHLDEYLDAMAPGAR